MTEAFTGFVSGNYSEENQVKEAGIEVKIEVETNEIKEEPSNNKKEDQSTETETAKLKAQIKPQNHAD